MPIISFSRVCSLALGGVLFLLRLVVLHNRFRCYIFFFFFFFLVVFFFFFFFSMHVLSAVEKESDRYRITFQNFFLSFVLWLFFLWLLSGLCVYVDTHIRIEPI